MRVTWEGGVAVGQMHLRGGPRRVTNFGDGEMRDGQFLGLLVWDWGEGGGGTEVVTVTKVTGVTRGGLRGLRRSRG